MGGDKKLTSWRTTKQTPPPNQKRGISIYYLGKGSFNLDRAKKAKKTFSYRALQSQF